MLLAAVAVVSIYSFSSPTLNHFNQFQYYQFEKWQQVNWYTTMSLLTDSNGLKHSPPIPIVRLLLFSLLLKITEGHFRSKIPYSQRALCVSFPVTDSFRRFAHFIAVDFTLFSFSLGSYFATYGVVVIAPDALLTRMQLIPVHWISPK